MIPTIPIPGGQGLVRNALALSHDYARAIIQPGDRVVDATCGKGRDTAFLAECVGPSGRVDAFDIQPAAIAQTGDTLRQLELTDRCHLHLASHDRMAEWVEPGIRCTLFNLGYLPGGDHAIGTTTATTLPALTTALRLTVVGGAVLVCLYYGGDSGFAEHDAVLAAVRSLPVQTYAVQTIELANAINCPPIFIAIEKLRDD
jgi:SAM-dependent methyltransferase